VSPQIFGVTMILIGLIALALAWIQHRRSMKALQAEFGAMPFSIAGVIAALIAGLGAIALIGVTLRF
jgi:putative membrane protein